MDPLIPPNLCERCSSVSSIPPKPAAARASLALLILGLVDPPTAVLGSNDRQPVGDRLIRQELEADWSEGGRHIFGLVVLGDEDHRGLDLRHAGRHMHHDGLRVGGKLLWDSELEGTLLPPIKVHLKLQRHLVCG
jgi:hypothetical protein